MLKILGPIVAGRRLEAVFVAHEKITDDRDDVANTPYNPGWHSFCAPIAPLKANGTLPSNEMGLWKLTHSTPVPAEWNALLSSVQEFSFFLDLNNFQTEEWGWDNVCLLEDECQHCLSITDIQISSTQSAPGSPQWTHAVSLTIKNESTATANVLRVPAVAPVPATPSVLLSPAVQSISLLGGQSTTKTIFVSEAPPGTKVCFPVRLEAAGGGKICERTICIQIPCLAFTNTSVTPIVGNFGRVQWQAMVKNTTAFPVARVAIVPRSPFVRASQAFVDFMPPLAPGQSQSLPSIFLDGVQPNSAVTLDVFTLDAGGGICCFDSAIINIPANSGFGGPGGDPSYTLIRTRPAVAGNAGVEVSFDGSFLVSGESIEKLPPVLGSPTCYRYSATITNSSSHSWTHLLVPLAEAATPVIPLQPPLAPGAAYRVSFLLCGVNAGTVSVPLTLINGEKEKCATFERSLDFVSEECATILEDRISCVGSDPEGNIIYEWSVTFLNSSGIPMTWALFGFQDAQMPSFFPSAQSLNNAPIAAGEQASASSRFTLPLGQTEVLLTFGLANLNKTIRCERKFSRILPDCCKPCYHQWRFDNSLPGGNLFTSHQVQLINVEQEQESNWMQFSLQTTTLPYLWVPNMTRGTVARIDTRTAQVVGEYYAAPEGHVYSTISPPKPQRVAVDQYGECWVANTGDNTSIQGSVTRIGLVLGGARGRKTPTGFVADASGGFLRGPFDYVSPSVSDRNGDGLIRTSRGILDLGRWDEMALGLDDRGGVSTAEDEAITDYVRTVMPSVRCLSIDAQNNVWFGSDREPVIQWLRGQTAGFGSAFYMPGGFGSVIDAEGHLWAVNLGVGLRRFHTTQFNRGMAPMPESGALCLDASRGEVWAGSLRKSHAAGFSPALNYYLRAYSVASGSSSLRAAVQPGTLSGITMSDAGVIWGSRQVSTGGPKAWAVHRSGTSSPPHISTSAIISGGGVGLDYLQRPWVLDYTADKVHCIAPDTRQVLHTVNLSPIAGSPAGPFAPNSDLSGHSALTHTAHHGSMSWVMDSLCLGKRWGRLTWVSGFQTNGAQLTVEVRAADKRLQLPRSWVAVTSGVPFCDSGVTGRYLEIRVNIRRPSRPNALGLFGNPILRHLELECCDQLSDEPPIGEIPSLATISTAQPIRIDAVAFDPENTALSAQWLVNGHSVGLALPSFNGQYSRDFTFESGQHTVTLQVTDGAGTTRNFASIVQVGDFQAPMLQPAPPRNVTGLTASIPDFRPATVVTDDVTPQSSLTKIQTPSPGTLVSPGVHEISLTTSDLAGRTTTDFTYFTVLSPLSLTGITDGQIFQQGESIHISPNIATGTLTPFRLIVDGEETGITATSGQAVTLTLPPGNHSLTWRLQTTPEPIESPTVNIWVKRLLQVPQPLVTASSAGHLSVSLPTQAFTELIFEGTSDLQSWSIIEVVEGNGMPVSRSIPTTNSRSFYRYRIRDTE